MYQYTTSTTVSQNLTDKKKKQIPYVGFGFVTPKGVDTTIPEPDIEHICDDFETLIPTDTETPVDKPVIKEPSDIAEAMIQAEMESHIIEEPATLEENIAAALIAPEVFESIHGELADGIPSVHPEDDAKYTEAEKEAIHNEGCECDNMEKTPDTTPIVNEAEVPPTTEVKKPRKTTARKRTTTTK